MFLSRKLDRSDIPQVGVTVPQIDKILWIIAVPAFLLLAWWEITSGMCRTDLAAAGAIILFIALCTGLYCVGRRLRGRTQLEEWTSTWFIFGAIVFWATDASLIAVGTTTADQQPWTFPLTGALLLAGMAYVAIASLMRGMRFRP